MILFNKPFLSLQFRMCHIPKTTEKLRNKLGNLPSANDLKEAMPARH